MKGLCVLVRTAGMRFAEWPDLCERHGRSTLQVKYGIPRARAADWPSSDGDNTEVSAASQAHTTSRHPPNAGRLRGRRDFCG